MYLILPTGCRSFVKSYSVLTDTAVLFNTYDGEFILELTVGTSDYLVRKFDGGYNSFDPSPFGTLTTPDYIPVEL